MGRDKHKLHVSHKTLKSRLAMLTIVCLIPMTLMFFHLIVLINRFSIRYERIVEDISAANRYEADFKEDMDYLMYIIAVNDRQAGELMKARVPYTKIEGAREVFQKIYSKTHSESSKYYLKKYSQEPGYTGIPNSED